MKNEKVNYAIEMIKEINIEYRTTNVDFTNYHYIIFDTSKIMEMD